MSRRAKPARGKALGILNPYGNLWTYETFETEAEARKYLSDFWLSMPGTTDLSKYAVIPVKITVSDARSALSTPAAGESAREARAKEAEHG